jgi:hypothetical protein
MTMSAWSRFDRRDERGDVLRIVRAVGVDEDDDAGGGGVDREPERLALAAAVVLNDARAVLEGDVARPIARVAVHDQHFVRVRSHRLDNLADESLPHLWRG